MQAHHHTVGRVRTSCFPLKPSGVDLPKGVTSQCKLGGNMGSGSIRGREMDDTGRSASTYHLSSRVDRIYQIVMGPSWPRSHTDVISRYWKGSSWARTSHMMPVKVWSMWSCVSAWRPQTKRVRMPRRSSDGCVLRAAKLPRRSGQHCEPRSCGARAGPSVSARRSVLAAANFSPEEPAAKFAPDGYISVTVRPLYCCGELGQSAAVDDGSHSRLL